MYRYLPLDTGEIRCLRLLPADSTNELYIEIKHCALHSSSTLYSALSYTWGDPEPLHQIRISGAADALRVRDNCWRFMKYWQERNSIPTDWIWIDAICINQADDDEKSSQVRRMRDIFERAQQVLVWFGPLSEQVAFSDFLLRNQDLLYAGRYWYEADQWDGLKVLHGSEWWQQAVLWPSSDPAARTLQNIVAADYWKRLWILQEVRFAKRHCFIMGEEIFSLRDMRSIDSLCQGMHRYLLQQNLSTWPDKLECMTAVMDIVPANSASTLHNREHDRLTHSVSHLENLFSNMFRPSKPLVQNLRDFKGQQCSNFRDRVYSLLSMSGNNHMFEIDYQCSAWQLFEATLHYLSQERSLSYSEAKDTILLNWDATALYSVLKDTHIEPFGAGPLPSMSSPDNEDRVKYNFVFDFVIIFERVGSGDVSRWQQVRNKRPERQWYNESVRFHCDQLLSVESRSLAAEIPGYTIKQLWRLKIADYAIHVFFGLNLELEIVDFFVETETNPVRDESEQLEGTIELCRVAGELRAFLEKRFTHVTWDSSDHSGGLLAIESAIKNDVEPRGLACRLSALEILQLYQMMGRISGNFSNPNSAH